MTTVAVTGANGFVASYVRDELAARGLDVRGFVRSRHTILADRLATTHFVEVDYESGPSVLQALEGVDAVVHLLGHAHQAERDPKVFERVNVSYTRRVLHAAGQAGVRRFIFLSSIKAVGNGAQQPYTEETTPNPMDHYGRSKLKAENVVQSMSSTSGIDFVILRPPLVYGAGVKGNLQRLIVTIDKGWPIALPRSVDNARSLISARNLASAIGEAVTWEERIDHSYVVCDGTDLSTPELVEMIAQVAGKKPRIVPLPPTLLRALARLVRQGPAADRFLSSLLVDATAFRTRFNWRPRQSTEDGLREAVEGTRTA